MKEILVLLTILAFCSPANSLADGEKLKGEALFHEYCSTCHGEMAVGQDPVYRQGGWRDDGSLIAPALDGSAHSWHHDPGLLYDYVKSGSPDPESPMPAFGEELTDEQIRAVIGYFQSLWPGKIRNLYEERFPGGLQQQPLSGDK